MWPARMQSDSRIKIHCLCSRIAGGWRGQKVARWFPCGIPAIYYRQATTAITAASQGWLIGSAVSLSESNLPSATYGQRASPTIRKEVNIKDDLGPSEVVDDTQRTWVDSRSRCGTGHRWTTGRAGHRIG